MGGTRSVTSSAGRSGAPAGTVLALVVCVLAALLCVGCVLGVLIGRAEGGPAERPPAGTEMPMTGMHDMSGH
ncbi:hypothetical protein [Umezawaea tangerina]|uniref:Uncharacterized protein n=1 Tax=Umezawaea tangerina TaxID=84725 RepID=A0A2T0STS3_9PSEU|nr:hypothetical protein [Umezawaea tangerina]PRY36821.1 hypothetical protein CLV43_111193 [Umezawaea tangerina]